MRASWDALEPAARTWLAADPDSDTRAELTALLAARDAHGLVERFGAELRFGTAGIRGALGAGPNRMNRLVVRRVTAGLARRLLDESAGEVRVVVGRDARHKSEDFAEDTARVLAGAGIGVYRFRRPVPTPLVAFAVRYLGASAGVVVTASHNPPSDNGYKVYWSDGAQIAPPLDSEIADAIPDVGDVDRIVLADGDTALIQDLDDDVERAYRESALRRRVAAPRVPLQVVYTPLHGVAGALCVAVLRTAGHTVHVVPDQAEPDPAFPTVAFPNPEEPGALDRATALAAERGADLVLANDPDGDRLAVAVPDRAGGGWRRLSGDEIGCLLAEHLLAHGEGSDRVVATTVVSSQLLARIAASHGVRHVETLTGFKWLAQVALAAHRRRERLVLAYEQALGFMVGDDVRDKDGITAALAFADLAAARRAAGGSVLDALDDLARAHGLHVTGARSLRLDEPDVGPDTVERVLRGLRSTPPADVAGVPVAAVADHENGVRRLLPDGGEERLSTPPARLVGLLLADGSRLQVRPSGTEPLLKFYGEVVEALCDGEVEEAQARARVRADRLLDAFVELAAVVR